MCWAQNAYMLHIAYRVYDARHTIFTSSCIQYSEQDCEYEMVGDGNGDGDGDGDGRGKKKSLES